jgi:hypothetical protein
MGDSAGRAGGWAPAPPAKRASQPRRAMSTARRVGYHALQLAKTASPEASFRMRGMRKPHRCNMACGRPDGGAREVAPARGSRAGSEPSGGASHRRKAAAVLGRRPVRRALKSVCQGRQALTRSTVWGLRSTRCLQAMRSACKACQTVTAKARPRTLGRQRRAPPLAGSRGRAVTAPPAPFRSQ